MKFNFILLTILLFILVNFLRFAIQNELEKNGYKTHLFWGHWNDMPNFRALINQEQDANKKQRLQTLQLSLNLASIFGLASFLLSLYLG